MFLADVGTLFVLLGVYCGRTDRMYRTLALWLSPLPGGLLHTNIGASAVFAAVSGSSVATAATISTVALPEFRKRKYNEKLVLGTIASAATLGILIPPSVNLIIFGALTNTSIGQLFVAGIIPGVCLTLLFMMSIMLIARIYPGSAETSLEKAPFKEAALFILFLSSNIHRNNGRDLLRMGNADGSAGAGCFSHHCGDLPWVSRCCMQRFCRQ